MVGTDGAAEAFCLISCTVQFRHHRTHPLLLLLLVLLLCSSSSSCCCCCCCTRCILEIFFSSSPCTCFVIAANLCTSCISEFFFLLLILFAYVLSLQLNFISHYMNFYQSLVLHLSANRRF